MRRSLRRVAAGVALAGAAVAVAAGCGGESSVSLQLREQGGSGQSGTATLSSQGSKTIVAIELATPAPRPQPSHIRRGTCKEPSLEPAFGLSNVEHRKSETTIDASLEELSSEGNYHVDVSKSVAEIESVVACGEIPEPAPTGGGYGGGY